MSGVSEVRPLILISIGGPRAGAKRLRAGKARAAWDETPSGIAVAYLRG